MCGSSVVSKKLTASQRSPRPINYLKIRRLFPYFREFYSWFFHAAQLSKNRMLLASRRLVDFVGTTFISQACYQPASSNINRPCPCQALMPAKQVLIGFGIDVDAVAGWWAFVIEKNLSNAHTPYQIWSTPRLGSYGGEDSPLDISRVGLYIVVAMCTRGDQVPGNVCRRSWGPVSVEIAQEIFYSSYMVHPWWIFK